MSSSLPPLNCLHYIEPYWKRAYIFKEGYLIISCYTTPSADPLLQINPPPHQQEPIVPFLFGIFIINPFSSEKKLYTLILRHHHSQNSSHHQQRAYFTIQKGLFHYQLLSHPISRASPIYYPPTPLEEHIVPFLLGIFIINPFLSEQIVYPFILRHHHSQH